MKLSLLIVLLPLMLTAQSHFLKKGEQGAMISAAYFTNEDASGRGLELSFASASTWDLVLGYSKAEFEADDVFSARQKPPALELLEVQLRFHPNNVLSPVVMLAFSTGRAGSRTKLSGWTAGAGIYKILTARKKLSIMPILMYAFYFVNTELQPEYFPFSYEVVSATPGLYAAAAILMHPSRQHALQIKPGFSINQEVKSFEIEISYLFSWTGNEKKFK